MIIHWPLLLLLVLFYASHSLLADLKIKAKLRSIIPYSYYRIVYNLLSLGFVIGIISTYANTAKVELLAPAVLLTFFGWLLMLSGVALSFLALSQYDGAEFIGTSYLNQAVETRAGLGGELNRSGVNAWVRHPIYTSILLMFWGWFLISPDTGVFHIALLTSIYIPIGIHYEEQKLLEEFGDVYRVYQQEVKKIIPGLW
ncbi:MAG: NnrU family protein [Bacteroidota bacterium]